MRKWRPREVTQLAQEHTTRWQVSYYQHLHLSDSAAAIYSAALPCISGCPVWCLWPRKHPKKRLEKSRRDNERPHEKTLNKPKYILFCFVFWRGGAENVLVLGLKCAKESQQEIVTTPSYSSSRLRKEGGREARGRAECASKVRNCCFGWEEESPGLETH